MTSAAILELRDLIAQKEGRHARERLPSRSLTVGIPRGAIVELSGTAKIEWVLEFLKDNPSLKVFWAESQFTLLPTAIHQRGVDPSRILFADCGEDLFPAIRMALRSQVFECMIAPSQFKEERFLKALQLLSEKANCTLFLLTEVLKSSWPISMQLEIDRGIAHEGFEIQLKKNKGGKDLGGEHL